MKYLRSIALLETVSKLLYEGQRTLPNLDQVKSAYTIMQVTTQEAAKTLNQDSQLLIAVPIQDLMKAFQLILKANNVQAKTLITTKILKKDFEGVKQLAQTLVPAGVDMDTINALCEAGDITRLYSYIQGLDANANIAREPIDQILKGVKVIKDIMCKTAYDYYNTEPVEVNDRTYNVLRVIVANVNHVDLKTV